MPKGAKHAKLREINSQKLESTFEDVKQRVSQPSAENGIGYAYGVHDHKEKMVCLVTRVSTSMRVFYISPLPLA